MRILYVAYPLHHVSDASAGGAEQMLWTLEREMHLRGHETTVAACAGSRVNGRLFSTGDIPTQSDTFEERNREHHAAIRSLLASESFDLIHDKSGSFFASAADVAVPILATAHLPRSFYPGVNWHVLGHNINVNCVSATQAHTFADVPNLVGWVQNGIAIDRFKFREQKDDYLLWLGRICEEKAPHLAIEAAKRSGNRLILAGQVYPFTYHEAYFAREIQPRLDDQITFIDSPTFDEKLDLLSRASALLIPSQVDETSSLVAMEAMACGTPVITWRRGALPEIVADGVTGYIVDSLEAMVSAISDVSRIRPEACRARVEQHFSASRMAADYAAVYQRVLGRSIGEAA
ncbi:glycosyl transferase, group 1 [Candidatus Koribacter versatilis Ellin345]|uniref:Glycosyl transferase, group 1 n=1 Tax=Koribacter versatilis (strain Ellin345) TaxID=204669 RepID=Q1IPW4_KORVE|nr:glycosyltransferase family 4 protein [Candidatus Koribacter versatilis]ABF41086.1 glycosyl transferase, group 1 [Candidatus Koribacter versatilis Ellin345]